MVAEQVRARVIIPMHYKTGKMKLPISGVEEFLKDKENVMRLDTSEVTFTRAGLPSSPQIMVLKPSL
jgi:L-ascorbate metabolism protein UlaG (beta-lactamase superfamily)